MPEPGQPVVRAPSSRPSGEAQAPTRREHWQALLLALACAVLFLRDGLSPARALVPHPPELFDVPMAEAIAAGRFDEAEVFRGNVGMTDKYLQSLCWDRVMQDRFRRGELPRWTRDIGAGAPFVPQMAQPYEPINLLLFVLPSAGWYGWWWLAHAVLFGWFAYLFLRRIGCRHEAALLGLVAAVLGTWTQSKLHHNVILTAALSLWPMLSATHTLVHGGAAGAARRRAVGWLALWTGLSWSSGFVVVSLQATYLTCAWALFSAWQAPAGERLRRLVPVGLGLGLGAVLSLANMLPVLLASTESARAGTFDAARLAALGLEWDHLLTLGWPDLLSWAADCFYPRTAEGLVNYDTRMPWSQLVLLEPLRQEDQSAFQNWVETSFAVGVAPLAFAVAAPFARTHRRTAWFFLVAALLAFGMATADEPFFSLARALPGVAQGDLRRLLFSVAMPLVVLAGLGADAWLRSEVRLAPRVLFGAVAAGSLCVLGWLWQHADPDAFVRGFAGLYVLDADAPEVVKVGGDATRIAAGAKALALPDEIANNQHALLASAARALFVAAAGLALAWRANARWTWPALLAATVLELLHAGHGPVQTVPIERVTTPPNVLAPVAAAAQPNGVRPRLCRLVAPDARKDAGLPGNVPGFLGIEDSSAYNPLPKARQEQFFAAIDPRCVYGGAGVGGFRDPAALRHALCDLFGIRYVMTALPRPEGEGLVDVTPEGTGVYHLYERPTALPRATFVREVDVLPDLATRLAALALPTRDVARRVVLEHADAPRPAAAEGSTADVEVVSHADEEVVVRVRCSHDGYVRLADPWDAGWTATVDGAPAEVLVADHYLRAVYVGPGEHELVFRYDGARVVWPLRLSLVGWLAVAFLFWTGRRRS